MGRGKIFWKSAVCERVYHEGVPMEIIKLREITTLGNGVRAFKVQEQQVAPGNRASRRPRMELTEGARQIGALLRSQTRVAPAAPETAPAKR